jgi:hypothetical protein
MIALTVADWPLSRRLLLEQRLQVDMLETTGFLAEQAAAQFPQLPLLLHNSVHNWSLGHPEGCPSPDAALARGDARTMAQCSPWVQRSRRGLRALDHRSLTSDWS